MEVLTKIKEFLSPRLVAREGELLIPLDTKIAGERIILRPICPDDSHDVFSEFTHEIATYMIPKVPESIDETKAFIGSSMEARENNHALILTIRDKVSNEFLGACGVHSRRKVTEPELGIWIKKGAQRKGFGKEAITILKNWSQHNLKCEGLVYPVSIENTPSRKIAEGLGGQIFKHRKSLSQSGNVLNEVVYMIKV